MLKDKLMRKGKRGILGLEELVSVLPSDIIGIEIGSYAGESTKIFLKSKKFKKLYCVDFWRTDFYTDRGNGEDLFNTMIKNYLSICEKVKIDSNDILSYFKEMEGKIDFVYIDGNHTYNQVVTDINNSLKLIKTQGIISGHDYYKDTPGVIKAVNEVFGKPDKIFSDWSWIKFLNRDCNLINQ